MTKNKYYSFVLVLISGLLFTGCFGVNADFHRLKHVVFSKIGGGYYTDTELGLGSLSLSLARTAVKFTDDRDAREIREMMKNVSSVQVGVYKRHGRGIEDVSKDYFMHTDSELTALGWHYVVKDRDCNSLTTVYYKEDEDGDIKELLIVSLDNHELVIADLEGDFNKLVAQTVARGNFRFDM